jgi:hypothetical protein
MMDPHGPFSNPGQTYILCSLSHFSGPYSTLVHLQMQHGSVGSETKGLTVVDGKEEEEEEEDDDVVIVQVRQPSDTGWRLVVGSLAVSAVGIYTHQPVVTAPYAPLQPKAVIGDSKKASMEMVVVSPVATGQQRRGSAELTKGHIAAAAFPAAAGGTADKDGKVDPKEALMELEAAEVRQPP